MMTSPDLAFPLEYEGGRGFAANKHPPSTSTSELSAPDAFWMFARHGAGDKTHSVLLAVLARLAQLGVRLVHEKEPVNNFGLVQGSVPVSECKDVGNVTVVEEGGIVAGTGRRGGKQSMAFVVRAGEKRACEELPLLGFADETKAHAWILLEMAKSADHVHLDLCGPAFGVFEYAAVGGDGGKFAPLSVRRVKRGLCDLKPLAEPERDLQPLKNGLLRDGGALLRDGGAFQDASTTIGSRPSSSRGAASNGPLWVPIPHGFPGAFEGVHRFEGTGAFLPPGSRSLPPGAFDGVNRSLPLPTTITSAPQAIPAPQTTLQKFTLQLHKKHAEQPPVTLSSSNKARAHRTKVKNARITSSSAGSSSPLSSEGCGAGGGSHGVVSNAARSTECTGGSTESTTTSESGSSESRSSGSSGRRTTTTKNGTSPHHDWPHFHLLKLGAAYTLLEPETVALCPSYSIQYTESVRRIGGVFLGTLLNSYFRRRVTAVGLTTGKDMFLNGKRGLVVAGGVWGECGGEADRAWEGEAEGREGGMLGGGSWAVKFAQGSAVLLPVKNMVYGWHEVGSMFFIIVGEVSVAIVCYVAGLGILWGGGFFRPD